MTGNPYFGKFNASTFKIMENEDIETRVKRMNELHKTDYKPSTKQKNRRKAQKL